MKVKRKKEFEKGCSKRSTKLESSKSKKLKLDLNVLVSNYLEKEGYSEIRNEFLEAVSKIKEKKKSNQKKSPNQKESSKQKKCHKQKKRPNEKKSLNEKKRPNEKKCPKQMKCPNQKKRNESSTDANRSAEEKWSRRLQVAEDFAKIRGPFAGMELSSGENVKLKVNRMIQNFRIG